MARELGTVAFLKARSWVDEDGDPIESGGLERPGAVSTAVIHSIEIGLVLAATCYHATAEWVDQIAHFFGWTPVVKACEGRVASI